MRERIIEVEAYSLAEARDQLDTDEDIIVIEVTVLNRERAETIESIADTIHEAVSKAKVGVPAKAKIDPHEIKTDARRVTVKAHGDNEEIAREEIKLKRAEVIESITLHRKGRKGFLGFFKRLNRYEVVLFQQAVVEVRFREKARLRARVLDYLAKDLLRIIEELRRRNARWEEAVQSLNPKNDERVRGWLKVLQESESFDLPNPLELIENACRRNLEANWGKAIERAYKEVLSAQSRLWEALRGLNVGIADTLTLYRVIRWEPKSRKEPTGIRREDYDPPRRPDERLRKKILCYSTDSEAFAELERKLEVIAGLRELYEECLREEGLKEDTATLRKKCEAVLEARRRQLGGKRKDDSGGENDGGGKDDD
jgi:hypothetical protein